MDLAHSEGACSSGVFPVVQQLVDSGYLSQNLCLVAATLPHASHSGCVVSPDAYCERQ